MDRRAEHRGVAGADRGVLLLASAVLLMALKDAQTKGPRRREALKWMREEPPEDQPGYIYTFQNLCVTLGIDPSSFVKVARRRRRRRWHGSYRLC